MLIRSGRTENVGTRDRKQRVKMGDKGQRTGPTDHSNDLPDPLKMTPNICNGNGADAKETTPGCSKHNGQNGDSVIGSSQKGVCDVSGQSRIIPTIKKGMYYKGSNMPRCTCITVPETINLSSTLTATNAQSKFVTTPVLYVLKFSIMLQ